MWKWTFEKLPNSRTPIRLLHKILAVPAVLELPHRFLISNGQVIVRPDSHWGNHKRKRSRT